VCGYNVEVKASFEGTATGGPKQISFSGTITAEAVVDTDAEVSFCSCAPVSMPFPHSSSFRAGLCISD
jgi:hypothetical protein